MNGSETIEGFLRVFQKYGYEGASLHRLVEETGLVKASLYHRFPEGKQQMAGAALEAALEQLSRLVLEVLAGEGPARLRLDLAIEHIRAFYASGRRSCLLETLSLCGTPDAVRKKAAQATKKWIAGLRKLAQSAGMPLEQAREAAEECLVQIEGALVISRLSGSTAPFQRALARLPGILLPDGGQ